MPQLHRFDNDSKIGDVSNEQLRFLIYQLANDEDTEFYVDYTILKSLADIGADRMLIGMLENSLGHHSWMKFTWMHGPPTPWIQMVPVRPGRRGGRV
ncbi:hypothetical protein [Streptomyces sp. NPDC051677]|uniref:hypothetical protein n=1 Tax=Streptomyces sp. NPDC051677 TaxID=3365669 RepID=UPI0037D266F0